MHENQSRAHGRFAADVESVESAREAIIAAKRAGATNAEAARQAQVTRMTMNRWMRADAVFAAAVNEAEQSARDERKAIAEAVRSGVHHRVAAQRAGIGKSTMYRWRLSDPTFAAAVREAERAVWQDRINAFADRYHAARATNAA